MIRPADLQERAHIREDLRNNIDGMSFYFQGLNKWLPHLLDAYEMAKEAGLPVQKMNAATRIGLANSCNNMLHQAYTAQQLVNNL